MCHGIDRRAQITELWEQQGNDPYHGAAYGSISHSLLSLQLCQLHISFCILACLLKQLLNKFGHFLTNWKKGKKVLRSALAMTARAV